jgi:hypothetical protein
MGSPVWDRLGASEPAEAVRLLPAPQNLVNAAIIPMRFGSSPDAGIVGLRKWQDSLAEKGLL